MANSVDPDQTAPIGAQGSKIALVRSYLRVPQAAGQAKILIFLVKIKFFPYMPIFFAMQGKCLFSEISRPGAVCSGSTLFAFLLNLSVMLGNFLQQTTSADEIFRCTFFLPLYGLIRVYLFWKIHKRQKLACLKWDNQQQLFSSEVLSYEVWRKTIYLRIFSKSDWCLSGTWSRIVDD